MVNLLQTVVILYRLFYVLSITRYLFKTLSPKYCSYFKDLSYKQLCHFREATLEKNPFVFCKKKNKRTVKLCRQFDIIYYFAQPKKREL